MTRDELLAAARERRAWTGPADEARDAGGGARSRRGRRKRPVRKISNGAGEGRRKGQR